MNDIEIRDFIARELRRAMNGFVGLQVNRQLAAQVTATLIAALTHIEYICRAPFNTGITALAARASNFTAPLAVPDNYEMWVDTWRPEVALNGTIMNVTFYPVNPRFWPPQDS